MQEDLIPHIAYKDFLINQIPPERDSPKYVPFWLKHIEYCKSGVVVGGVPFSGWLYWHLNFFRIPKDVLNKYGEDERVIGPPDFRDNEFFINWGIESSKEQQRPLMMFGARRIAKSVTLASKCSYTMFIKNNSHTLIIGADSNDLGHITDYIEKFYEARPDCFSDFRMYGLWKKKELNFNKKEVTKKDAATGAKGVINPITRHLIDITTENTTSFSSISVMNLEHGKKMSKQELLAGGTPSEVILDECGKFGYREQYSALKPALMTNRGTYRTLPLFSGCLTAGNKVWCKNGDLVNIEDLQKSDGILGFSIEDQKVIAEDITHMNPPQEKKCYRVTTNKGSSITCSWDHPILKRHRDQYKQFTDSNKKIHKRRKLEFIHTDKLSIGDHIAIADSIPNFSEKTIWEPYLVGALIGDGSYGIDKTPVLSNEDSEIWDYVETLGLDTVIETQRVTDLGRTYKEVRIKGITKELRGLGIYGQTKSKKRLPAAIFNSSENTIIQLIAGLFDTDGCVSYGKANAMISISSISVRMLEDIKLLLVKLGIHSNIGYIKADKRDRDIKGKQGYYVLGIYDRKSILKFHATIPLKISRKQNNLNILADIYAKRKNKVDKNYPGLRFETIQEIVCVDNQPVYNLTTSTTHTYIANNIITHNTGGNTELSKDAEKDFLYADKSGFFHADINEFLKIVKPKYFQYKQESDLKTGLFPVAEMCNAGGQKLSIPISEYLNREFTPKELKDLEGFNIWVTDWETAREKVLTTIKVEKFSSDTEGKKAQMYYPFQPEDCFLSTKSSEFPTLEARKAAKNIWESGVTGEYVDLIQNLNGTVSIEPSNKDIVKDFPYAGGAHDAPVVIYERPPTEEPRSIGYGSYVGGYDGYKIATSKTTDSVGSFYIYKRHVGLTGFQDQIVASIASRPTQDEIFYEQVYLLAKIYNAEILPESDVPFFKYMDSIKQTHYLADCTNLAKGIVKSTNTNANLTYGLPATAPNKEFYLRQVKNYCWEKIVVGYEEENIDMPIYMLGVHRIPDPLLLEEIAQYGDTGNYDRIAAFGHALSWNAEMKAMGVVPGDIVEEKKTFNHTSFLDKIKKMDGRR